MAGTEIAVKKYVVRLSGKELARGWAMKRADCVESVVALRESFA